MTIEPNSTLPSEPLHLKAGQKLGGCYLLEQQLEVGGDHLIWIAQDEVLGKRVSLHFLPETVAQDPEAIEALRQEVKRNRPLIHPGVLRVYDLVEGEDWTAVAMESFEGRCLAALLDEKGRFEVDELESWFKQVCATLEEAHRIRLTHRDLAPENLFVSSTGRLLLANFGLSRVVQDSLQRRKGAEAGQPRLHTASPEMLEGSPATEADDVYGVGTLLFELLAGRRVFTGGDVAEKVKTEVPPRLSEVRDETADRGRAIPPGWENVIAACLNKHRDERPHRPSEIVSSIEAYRPPSVVPAASLPAVSTEVPPAIEPVAEEREEPNSEPESAPISQKTEMPEDIEEPEPVPIAAEPEPTPFVPENESMEPEPASVSPSLQTEATEVESEPEPAPVTAPVPAARQLETDQSPVVQRPVRQYDSDEDAFSGILPRRFRFPAAVAAVVVLLLLLANGFFSGSKEKTSTPPAIATTDSVDRSELTSVKNSMDGAARAEEKTPPAATLSNPDADSPAPAATRKAPAAPETLLAAGPAPSVSPAGAAAGMPLDKQITEKSALLERLKQELAASEKAQQARAKEQQAAAAALAEAQRAIEEKTKSAVSVKKVADELLAARKKREEDRQAADTAAQAAQQLAAEKVRAAEEARKALADFETQNRDKLAAQDKINTEIQTLQQTLADRQKVADEQSKAATAAETARQQQLAAVQQTEQELASAKASIAKASAEDERRRLAAEAERRKLDDEITSMRALFEQKMKDIEDRRRQLESGVTAPAPAAGKSAAPSADLKLPTAPAPALPLMAMKTEAVPVPAPVVPALPVAPAPAGSGGGNSLGMRFAPVGDVQFCIWQTRVKDFETFAKAVNLKSTAWRGPGFRQGPDHPVVNVTWTEAIQFCKWLTDKERKDGSLPANQFYRLPYDLEWSKAVLLPDETGKTPEARDMGVPDIYPWGTDWPPPKGAGNYTGEETGSDVAIKGYDDGFAWTAPVGSFPPNKLGLHDMGGNVWQWCMDSWNSESKAKVLRGASWYNGALKLSLLSSCRVHAAPDSSTDNYGFRIVRATETAVGKPAKK